MKKCCGALRKGGAFSPPVAAATAPTFLTSCRLEGIDAARLKPALPRPWIEVLISLLGILALNTPSGQRLLTALFVKGETLRHGLDFAAYPIEHRLILQVVEHLCDPVADLAHLR